MLNHNNMPGAGSIADTMEFMRKMWGSMGAPSMGIPSLSVEEINKKIADLKTVASWLELNMNMLRATIQTLEVQSATLSTLQAMGAILTPQADAAGAKAKEATSPFGFPTWPTPQPESRSEPQSTARDPVPEPRVEDMEDEDDNDHDTDAATADEASAAPVTPETSQAAKEAAATPPDFQAAMANPNAWWNLLQEQFQQAVGNVLADQAAAPKTAKSAPTATGTVKPAAKAAAKAAKPAAPKKTTKPKAAAKPGTRAKSTVVQSRQPKPVSRQKKSP